MKPSGIEWIGDIPAEWEVTKIKYSSKLSGRIGWQGLTSSEYMEEGPYLITGTDFENGSINFKQCVHITESRWREAKEIQVENGDLLITKDGTVGKVAIISELDDKASLNSGVLHIQPIPKVHTKYLYYVLVSEEFWLWFNYTNSGVSTILHLYQNVFDNFSYTMPPLSEQQAIAAFLDAQCGTIDGIIAEMEQQIEVLKQYKTALITETVTKGLDKTAPMKDSGIDWIGKIPEHWESTKIKYFCSLKTGSTPANNEGINYEENGYNWYTPSDFNDSLLLNKSEKFIDDDIVNHDKIALLEKDSVLIIGIGATVGKVGYCNKPAHCNQQITAMIPQNVAGKYLLYFMFSQSNFIKDNALYTTLPIINNLYLSNVYAILPPLNEQKMIAVFLDKKCKEIADIMAEKRQSIETMREYKKSIIYEYVTGKKRVRGTAHI